jgi:Rrf2 family transcriptional regulator, iron-sulfur cluster assembly transcription factor
MSRFANRGGRSGSEPWRLLSQTAEYAIRAVVYVARRSDAVPASEIATALAVPTRYLAHVLNELVRAGVLDSMRGASGGFGLRRPAADIPLADVVSPFDGVAGPSQCLLRPQRCGTGTPCIAHSEWRRVADTVRGYFHETCVADLASEVGGGSDPAPHPAFAGAVQTRRKRERSHRKEG